MKGSLKRKKARDLEAQRNKEGEKGRRTGLASQTLVATDVEKRTMSTSSVMLYESASGALDAQKKEAQEGSKPVPMIEAKKKEEGKV